MMTRQAGAGALAAIASILLVAATVAGYAGRAVGDSDQFANRAAAALRDERVRTLVAERVTDQFVLRNEADLITARPIISSVISEVVGGGAFGSLFRRAALDAHRAIFDRDQDTIVLTVGDVGTVAGAALERFEPELAAKLEAGRRVRLVTRDLGRATATLVRVTDDVGVLAYVLGALSLLTLVVALIIAPDRRRAVSWLGAGVVVAGLVIVVAYAVARAAVLGGIGDSDSRAAAGAIWDAFLGDLRTWAWLLVVSGAVVAAAAASVLRPIALEPRLRRAWQLVASEPESTGLRLARAAGLIAAGALVIAEPAAALQVAATLAGAYVAYKGVEAVLRLVYRPTAPAAGPDRRGAGQRRGRRIAVALLAGLLIAGAVSAFTASGAIEQPATPISACNGASVLCDRPLDEVVLPATHNSMSAPLPGWYSSQQDRPIAGQLEDGIRGLLIDTHYADRLANGRVRTHLADAADRERTVKQDGVSADAVEAALRLRARLGFRGAGERGMYLCHTFCELGATPRASGLDGIHDFLVTHPNEVVLAINQDYVTPADFVAAVEDAGLTPYVSTPPRDGDWPTLRQMIEADRRLILLAENDAGAAPWYQLAYARLTQETPFAFGRPAALTTAAALPASCEANRGPDGAPLFLINHWITTDPVPRPSNATKVNAYEPLLRRARVCERLRKHAPNLLAVDFYKRGDVFRVADTLNGIPSDR